MINNSIFSACFKVSLGDKGLIRHFLLPPSVYYDKVENYLVIIA